MKNNVLLKTLIILIIITICAISFVGIYVKDKNAMKNIVPEYQLGMNLGGSRVIKMVLDDTRNEVIYDNEGNISEDGENEDGSLKEGYTKQEEKVNPDENLILDNFEKSKNIIEKRLDKLGVKEYIIKQNTENGEIIIEMPEDTTTDEVIAYIPYLGKFQIQDSDTEEVLMDNSNIKDAKVVYGSTDYGTTVYLQIEFNKEGKSKLENITNTYIKTTDEEGNETTKNIVIELDGEKLIQTYFSETINTGMLQLSIGAETTSSEEINTYVKQASIIATLISEGKMPLKYEIEQNRFIASAISEDVVKNIIIGLVAVLAISLIYLIIKYKSKGVLTAIAFIGLIATLLLAIRYGNVVISLESIVAIITILIVNFCFVNYILKENKQKDMHMNEAIKQAYIKYISILIPLLIIAVTFTFINWTPIASIGMVMFWGILILVIYNYTFTRTLLLNSKKSSKE